MDVEAQDEGVIGKILASLRSGVRFRTSFAS